VHPAATADLLFGDDTLAVSVPAVRDRIFYPISAIVLGETRVRRLLYGGEAPGVEGLLAWGFPDREIFRAL